MPDNGESRHPLRPPHAERHSPARPTPFPREAIAMYETKTVSGRFVRLYERGQRFVVFDVETAGSHIVEIGAVEAGKDYADNYRHFQKILRFRPDSWKPYWRELQIHQIPPEEIENGEDRLTVFREFLEFAQGATLICHTSFDIQASLTDLRRHPELQPFLASPMWVEYVDSCRLAREICPQLGSFSLKNLARYYRIDNPQAHRAFADAWTTKKLVARLLLCHYMR